MTTDPNALRTRIPGATASATGPRRQTRAAKDADSAASTVASMSPWVERASQLNAAAKLGLAEHVARHLVEYGMVIYMGPGTTNNRLAERIFQRQIEDNDPLDLVILTNNLTIFATGSDRAREYPDLFSTTQIISTGGTYQQSINSVVGRFAVKSIESDILYPHLILLGASGVSFGGEGSLSYHFEEELDSQLAYATRPTDHRVLVCDYEKLERAHRWMGASVRDLLRNTPRCTIITSYPSDANAQKRLRQVVGEFVALRDRLDVGDDVLALRVVDSKGAIVLSADDVAGRSFTRSAAD